MPRSRHLFYYVGAYTLFRRCNMPEQNSFITNVFKTEDETERRILYTQKWIELAGKPKVLTYRPSKRNE